MRKYIFLILVLIIACGGSSEETVAQDTTTTTIQDTTTTTIQDTTTTTIQDTTTTTIQDTTTTTTDEKNKSCDYKNNNIYIDIQNTDNDGVLSSGSSTNKTYSLSQLPYAELLKVNKNNDGYIESIQICHSNLEIFEIFSNNPYCFFRFSNIESSNKPTLQTFILTDVFPKDKTVCNQLNEDAIFKADEIRFYTKTKKPSMSFVLKKNGEYKITVGGNDNSDCCLNSTFNIFNYGTTTTTTSSTTTSSTTTSSTTTTTLPQFNEYTLPSLSSISISEGTFSSSDSLTINYDISIGSKPLIGFYLGFDNKTYDSYKEIWVSLRNITSTSGSANIDLSQWIDGAHTLSLVQIRDDSGGIVTYQNGQTYKNPKNAPGGDGDTNSLFDENYVLFTVNP